MTDFIDKTHRQIITFNKDLGHSYTPNLNARLIRDGNVVYTGKISSIYREKNAAKQVSAGLECGIALKNFVDYKKNDIIEVYNLTKIERRI